MKNRKILLLGMIFIAFAFVVGFMSTASAQATGATVCCEKTKSNLYCHDVPSEQCDPGSRQVPTSCRSTSYCKPGVCYDSNEGTCLDNTPQLVCNNNDGLWSATNPAQCELGCCVLGDQAAFVSLVRCKKLSGSLGLETDFKKDIKNEVACIASVYGQEKGACVYTSEFEKTCRFTTREDCTGKISAGVNRTSSNGDFYPGKLCSAEELGTTCGLTTKTTCVPGKEEVYFVDTCGNPANIYDAGKVNDKNYWTDVKDKSESCNPNGANAGSASCGNCNYLLGGICRKTASTGTRATYGENICADLNCKNTQNGKTYKHGESWCVNNDKGTVGKNDNSVGSGFFRHLCINGEEVVEACTDFRQYECIEDKITTSAGEFSQAACRVNRWQDCRAQTERSQCENTDKRDCNWIEGSGCVPENSPGLKFWEEGEAKNICGQANSLCVATAEKGLIGSSETWSGECVTSSGEISQSWETKNVNVCKAVGDCGPKINWLGDKGYAPTSGANAGRVGYTITTGSSRGASSTTQTQTQESFPQSSGGDFPQPSS